MYFTKNIKKLKKKYLKKNAYKQYGLKGMTENLNTILDTINQNITEYSKEDMQILKFLKMVGESKDLKDIKEPSLLFISTRSAKCKLTNKIDMKIAAPIIKKIVEKGLNSTIVGLEFGQISVGQVKKKKKLTTIQPQKFYNQATVIMKPHKNGKNINVKFFLNGSISMTGCKEEEDGINVMKNFIKEIKKYPQVFYEKYHKNSLDIVDYKITMINSNYIIGFKVDRPKLYKLLIDDYKIYTSYDSSIYQGVKIGYMWNDNHHYKDGICQCSIKCRFEKNARKKNKCKLVTIAIFQSGNIIITGANQIKQILEAYEYINQILYDNYSIIVRFSILDCDISD